MNIQLSTTFAIIEWSIAGLLVISISFYILMNLPEPQANSFIPSFNESKQTTKKTSNPSCCIATILNSDNFLNVLTLGYSIHQFSSSPPKAYLFNLHNYSLEKMAMLEKYFILKDPPTNEKNKFDQLLYWSLDECQPLIAVSSNGIFTKNYDYLCNSQPFAAVALNSDIVYFDSSLMVINPKEKIDQKMDQNKFNSFQDYINEIYYNWTSLPTYSNVWDYQNDFLAFWLTFQTPTYIHYHPSSFKKALTLAKEYKERSSGLYKMILSVVNSTMKQFPTAFMI